MFPIILSNEEVEELIKFMQTVRDARLYRRAQAVWLNYLGKSILEIAKIINVNERTIYRWLYAYKKEKLGGLFINFSSGRPPKIDEKYKELLLETIRKDPKVFNYPTDRWTLKLLTQHMAWMTGTEVSSQRIRQILFSYKIVFHKPRIYVINPKKGKIVRLVKKIR